MTENDESKPDSARGADEQNGAQGEHEETHGDQAQRTAPPGNPATDQDAVDKGEDNLGRVAGR